MVWRALVLGVPSRMGAALVVGALVGSAVGALV
jgi:hypothetical protein